MNKCSVLRNFKIQSEGNKQKSLLIANTINENFIEQKKKLINNSLKKWVQLTTSSFSYLNVL